MCDEKINITSYDDRNVKVITKDIMEGVRIKKKNSSNNKDDPNEILQRKN